MKTKTDRNDRKSRGSRLERIQNWPELAETARYSATELAALCHVSARQLRRFIRKKHGKPLRIWLNCLCQLRAAELLQDRRNSVKEVAHVMGYHPNAFSRAFKNYFGRAPTSLG